MPVEGCRHFPHHASLCSTYAKQPFSGGHQGCTRSRAKLWPLPRAEQQNSQGVGDKDDAAYLKRLLGDSARRLPKQLSPKAKKQLQQLRLERMRPLNHPHAAQSAITDAVGNLTSTSASTALALCNSISIAQEDSLADSGTTERLPTKAELRGTLGTVNRKVYEQVTQSRNRLSTRLSAANKHIRQLQKAAEGHQQEVAVMHDCMTQIMTELTTLGRVADAAAASVHYGTEQKESIVKMSNLHDRVQVLQQVVQSQAGQVGRLKQRKIPVVWFGIAQEVRLMGSFDNWTQGFSLSAEEFSDGTFTKFQGTLRLVPGQYEVKFLVDGQWRTAPDWPSVHTPHGANNVLQVD